MAHRVLPLFIVVTFFVAVPVFGLNAAELWNGGKSDSKTQAKGTVPVSPGGLTSSTRMGKYYVDPNTSGVETGAEVEEEIIDSNTRIQTLRSQRMMVGAIPEARVVFSESWTGPVPQRKLVSSKVRKFMSTGARNARLSDVQHFVALEHEVRKAVRAGAIQMKKADAKIRKENEAKEKEYIAEFHRRKGLSNSEILAENARLYERVKRDMQSGRYEAIAKTQEVALGGGFQGSERVTSTRKLSLVNSGR